MKWRTSKVDANIRAHRQIMPLKCWRAGKLRTGKMAFQKHAFRTMALSPLGVGGATRN
jgi:hypothetical protein